MPGSQLKYDLTGKTFHRWTAISHVSHGSWKCVCECGTTSVVEGKNLRYGKSKSCGCYTVDVTRQRSTTHGNTANLKRTPEYESYRNMLARCFRKSSEKYPIYGGRGITVCERWRSSFQAFLEDMGKRPAPGLTLDRKDTDGNYEPSNCRWATAKTQGRNKRATIKVDLDGESVSLAEACDRLGINYKTVHSRMFCQGLSFEEAASKPIDTRRWDTRRAGITPESVEKAA